jgi:hypothetical protein
MQSTAALHRSHCAVVERRRTKYVLQICSIFSPMKEASLEATIHRPVEQTRQLVNQTELALDVRIRQQNTHTHTHTQFVFDKNRQKRRDSKETAELIHIRQKSGEIN